MTNSLYFLFTVIYSIVFINSIEVSGSPVGKSAYPGTDAGPEKKMKTCEVSSLPRTGPLAAAASPLSTFIKLFLVTSVPS